MKRKRELIHFLNQHTGIRVWNRHWRDGEYMIPDGSYIDAPGGIEISGKNHKGENVRKRLRVQDLFLWEEYYG